jgi:serine protease Do
VEELTPDLSRKLNMGKVTGVIVSEVEPASFAEDIGFNRGDVIIEINHTPVNNLADYRREMAQLKAGQDVLFKVAQRGANDRVLTLFLAGAVPAAQ